jgi:hypothetical protein
VNLAGQNNDCWLFSRRCIFSALISETVPRFLLQLAFQQLLGNLILISPPYH